MLAGADDSFDILEIRAAEKLAGSPPVPQTLVSRQAARASTRARVRRFELGSSDINDLRMDMGRIGQVACSTATFCSTKTAG